MEDRPRHDRHQAPHVSAIWEIYSYPTLKYSIIFVIFKYHICLHEIVYLLYLNGNFSMHLRVRIM